MSINDDQIKARIADPDLKNFWKFQELKSRYWYKISKHDAEEPFDFWDVHFTSEADKEYFLKVIEFMIQNPMPK